MYGLAIFSCFRLHAYASPYNASSIHSCASNWFSVCFVIKVAVFLQYIHFALYSRSLCLHIMFILHSML
jgi:hypothetical protein